ncbi:hypothetical protein ACFL6C_00445 [Myxococcota bacterium]
MARVNVNAKIVKARDPDSPGGARIWKGEMNRIVREAMKVEPGHPSDKPLTQGEVDEIKAVAPAEMSGGAVEARDEFLLRAENENLVYDPQEPTPDPTPDEQPMKLRSDRKVWSCTYWPMAGSVGDPDGSPSSNLWATDGCLDKFDSYREAKGLSKGALDYERTPSLNWLGGHSKTGYYIPSDTLDEKDAERTTGVDFNGNGKIDPDVEHDFIFAGQLGRTNGKCDETLGVGWWGSCGQVAMAGVLFEKPKRGVERNGVKFTTGDMMGLLTVIAKSQSGGLDWALDRYDGKPDEIKLTSGRTLRGKILDMDISDFRDGNFRRADGDRVVRLDYDEPVKIEKLDGKIETIQPTKFRSISRESKCDSPYAFHTTLISWLKDNRPFSMDHDSGDHVWNDSYDGANITPSPELQSGLNLSQLNGFKGPYKGGKLKFYETEVLQGDYVAERYSYWFEEKDGQVINSGWLGHNKPDFMHRPRNAEPSFTGYNSRNPSVDPKLVKELYLASIGKLPASDRES